MPWSWLLLAAATLPASQSSDARPGLRGLQSLGPDPFLSAPASLRGGADGGGWNPESDLGVAEGAPKPKPAVTKQITANMKDAHGFTTK